MYLCGTKYYAICYQGELGGDSEVDVHGFFDAYWVVSILMKVNQWICIQYV
jgi:hypothetical protein